MTPELSAAFEQCVPAGVPVVVALGGGADSAVLLGTAVAARGTDDVRCVFVYHGLEGSDLLRDAAEALSAQMNVRFDVLEAAVADGSNLEERARDARYRVIGDHLGAEEVCCTGHTADDQAETVLMRLLRGSGTDGLGGIPAVRHPYYRPFLPFERAALRNVAEESRVPFVDDPANDDHRFLRSRLRTDLIPTVEQNYSESFRSNLARSAELLAADAATLEHLADRVPLVIEDAAVSVPVAALVTVPPSVAARVVRRVLAEHHRPFRGSHGDVSRALLTARDGDARTLSGGIQCAREGPLLRFSSDDVATQPDHVEVAVGDHFVWNSVRYRVRRAERPSDLVLSDIRTAIGLNTAEGTPAITVRSPMPGDVIDVGVGSTPVSEILRDGDVPPRNRGNRMLITVGDEIAAVRGLRVAAWARPTPDQQAIVIEREGQT